MRRCPRPACGSAYDGDRLIPLGVHTSGTTVCLRKAEPIDLSDGCCPPRTSSRSFVPGGWRAAWSSSGARLSDAFRRASATTRPGPPPLFTEGGGTVADALLLAARFRALASRGMRAVRVQTFFESVTLVDAFRRAAAPRPLLPFTRDRGSSLLGARFRRTQDESASAQMVDSGGPVPEEESLQVSD